MQTAFQAEKPYNRPSGDGNAPLSPPTAVLPPEGEVLAALGYEMIMRINAERRVNLPHRGGKGTGFVGECSDPKIQ